MAPDSSPSLQGTGSQSPRLDRASYEYLASAGASHAHNDPLRALEVALAKSEAEKEALRVRLDEALVGHFPDGDGILKARITELSGALSQSQSELADCKVMLSKSREATQSMKQQVADVEFELQQCAGGAEETLGAVTEAFHAKQAELIQMQRSAKQQAAGAAALWAVFRWRVNSLVQVEYYQGGSSLSPDGGRPPALARWSNESLRSPSKAERELQAREQSDPKDLNKVRKQLVDAVARAQHWMEREGQLRIQLCVWRHSAFFRIVHSVMMRTDLRKASNSIVHWLINTREAKYVSVGFHKYQVEVAIVEAEDAIHEASEAIVESEEANSAMIDACDDLHDARLKTREVLAHHQDLKSELSTLTSLGEEAFRRTRKERGALNFIVYMFKQAWADAEKTIFSEGGSRPYIKTWRLKAQLNTITILNKSVTSLSEKVALLNQEVTSVRSEKTKLEKNFKTEKADMEKKFKSEKTTLEKKVAEMTPKMVELDAALKNITILKTSKAELEKKIIETTEKIVELNGAVDELNHHLEEATLTLASERKSHEKEVSDMQNAHEDEVLSIVKGYEEELASLRKQLEELEKLKKELEETYELLRGASTTLAEVTTERDYLKSLLEAKGEAIPEISAPQEALVDEDQALLESRTALYEAYAEELVVKMAGDGTDQLLVDELNKCKQELKRLQMELATMTLSEEAKAKEIDALKLQIKQLQAEIEMLKNSSKHPLGDDDAKLAEIQNLRKKLLECQQQLAALQAEIEVLKKDIVKKDAEIESLRKQVAEQEIEIERLKAELAKLKDSDTKLKSKIKELQEELDALKNAPSNIVRKQSISSSLDTPRVAESVDTPRVAESVDTPREDLSAELAALKAKYENELMLKIQLSEVVSELQVELEHANELKPKLAMALSEISDLERKLLAANQRVTKLEAALAEALKLEPVVAEKAERILDLENQLAEALKLIATLKFQLKQMTDEVTIPIFKADPVLQLEEERRKLAEKLEALSLEALTREKETRWWFILEILKECDPHGGHMMSPSELLSLRNSNMKERDPSLNSHYEESIASEFMTDSLDKTPPDDE